MQTYTIEFAILKRYTMGGVPADEVASVLSSIEEKDGTVYQIVSEREIN
jgi:hypothetical protein